MRNYHLNNLTIPKILTTMLQQFRYINLTKCNIFKTRSDCSDFKILITDYSGCFSLHLTLLEQIEYKTI